MGVGAGFSGARNSGATAVLGTVYGAVSAGSAVNSHDGTSSRSPATSRAARPNTAAVTGTRVGATVSTTVRQGAIGSTGPEAGFSTVPSFFPFPSTAGGSVAQPPMPIGPVPFASSFSCASAFAAPTTGYVSPFTGSLSIPLPATGRPSRAMCSPVDQP